MKWEVARQRDGLLGWLSLRIGNLLLDGVALRRTSRGDLTLSWPARRDRGGRDHPVVWPVDDAAHNEPSGANRKLPTRRLL